VQQDQIIKPRWRRINSGIFEQQQDAEQQKGRFKQKRSASEHCKKPFQNHLKPLKKQNYSLKNEIQVNLKTLRSLGPLLRR
jgi:hypothetical protein